MSTRFIVTETTTYAVDADSEEGALETFVHDGGEFLAVECRTAEVDTEKSSQVRALT